MNTIPQIKQEIQRLTSLLSRMESENTNQSVDKAFHEALEDAKTKVDETLQKKDDTSPSKVFGAETVKDSFLLKNDEYINNYKPTVNEFMAETNLGFKDATELLYGTIGANGDYRNWTKIMESDDIVSSVRTATRELYESELDYVLSQAPEKNTPVFNSLLESHTLSDTMIINKTGLVAQVEGEETNEVKHILVDQNNLILRGSSEQTLEKNRWYFNT